MNMKDLEISAKTVEEAIQQGLEQLGLTREQAEIAVLREGRSGIFGLGSENALVRVKPLVGLGGEQDAVREARGVLEKLLELMGVAAVIKDVPASSDEMPVTLSIEGEDSGILIGHHGQNLAALQYIVKLITAHGLKRWLPITIDVGDYKRHRYEVLRGLALRLAEQVKRSRHLITLEPMPSDERRIIHLALADHPAVTTESVDEAGKRKVVISYKGV